jgi:hypothetical protein
MSRAFVNEDAGEAPGHYPLPPRDDPGYSLAAARALLHGADRGDTPGAEAATGYFWGDAALAPEVERILAEARDDGNERLEQLAERFLRRVSSRRRSLPDR